MTPPSNIRKHFADCVSLLADTGAQAKYEKDVPFVPAHVELIETFYDLYIPSDPAFISAFTKEEAMSLAELERLLSAAAERKKTSAVHSVVQLQELPDWQLVVRHAQVLYETFRKRG
jgi:hypothetical protein